MAHLPKNFWVQGKPWVSLFGFAPVQALLMWAGLMKGLALERLAQAGLAHEGLFSRCRAHECLEQEGPAREGLAPEGLAHVSLAFATSNRLQC